MTQCLRDKLVGRLAITESGFGFGFGFGGRFANYDWVGSHEHLIILTAENTACGGAALATVGGDGGAIFTANGINVSLGIPALLHEFGHNLGFLHASSFICKDSVRFDATISAYTYDSAICPPEEYGDSLDIMGYTVSGATPHLSTPQRILAGYLTNYEAYPDTGTTTTALGKASGTQALVVDDPRSHEIYIIECRSAEGVDSTSAEYRFWPEALDVGNGFLKYSFTTKAKTGGVRILRLVPFGDAGTGDTQFGTTVLAATSTDGTPSTGRHILTREILSPTSRVA